MELIEFDILNTPQPKEDVVLCLGYFDGLHLGHQSIINKAKKEGYPVAVLTFDNSPSFVLGKKVTNSCLTSVVDKVDYLEQMGVKYLYLMNFDENTIYYSKDEFIDMVLKVINPKKIFVGEDYKFGAWGSGDAQYLKNYFNVDISKLMKVGGEKISSRVIRDYVKEGEMEKVQSLLGRYYRVSGLVVEGKQNGRKMDFPTANLSLDYPYVFPKEGVYMGYVEFFDEKKKAIISVSKHPSIMELREPIIEVHIIDFDQNLYGSTLFVDFVSFMRDIMIFENLDELKAQIEKDKEIAKNTLK